MQISIARSSAMQSELFPPKFNETSSVRYRKIYHIPGACFTLATGHMSTYMCGITDLTPWRQWLRDAPRSTNGGSALWLNPQENGLLAALPSGCSLTLRAVYEDH